MTPESVQTTNAPSQGRLRFLAILVSVLVATLLGWGVGEVYVRMTRPHVDLDDIRAKSLEYETTLFSRHAFPKQIQVRGVYQEDTINERGYRGPPFQVPKPPGVVRVVTLGGSSTYDPHAKAGRDWPRLVEAKLREMGFPQVEVINAGTPGHATWDSLGRFYSELWMFEPDYVLICHGWNDITYFRWLNPDKSLLRGYRPASTLPGSQALLVDNPFMYHRGALDRLLSHSQLYAHVRWRFWEWRLGVLGTEDLVRLGGRPARQSARFADTDDTYSEWGPRQFELDLRLLVDAARDVGATPVLLTQPRLLSPPASQMEEKRLPLGSVGLTVAALRRAFTDVDGAIHRVGKDKHVTVLELAEKFSEQPDLFVRHVHLSATGSDTISTAVAEGLAPMIKASRAPQAAKDNGASGVAQRSGPAGDRGGVAPAKPSEPKPRG